MGRRFAPRLSRIELLKRLEISTIRPRHHGVSRGPMAVSGPQNGRNITTNRQQIHHLAYMFVDSAQREKEALGIRRACPYGDRNWARVPADMALHEVYFGFKWQGSAAMAAAHQRAVSGP